MPADTDLICPLFFASLSVMVVGAVCISYCNMVIIVKHQLLLAIA